MNECRVVFYQLAAMHASWCIHRRDDTVVGGAVRGGGGAGGT